MLLLSFTNNIPMDFIWHGKCLAYFGICLTYLGNSGIKVEKVAIYTGNAISYWNLEWYYCHILTIILKSRGTKLFR